MLRPKNSFRCFVVVVVEEYDIGQACDRLVTHKHRNGQVQDPHRLYSSGALFLRPKKNKKHQESYLDIMHMSVYGWYGWYGWYATSPLDDQCRLNVKYYPVTVVVVAVVVLWPGSCFRGRPQFLCLFCLCLFFIPVIFFSLVSMNI